MTIEYKDSKRISALSSDALVAHLKFNDNVTDSAGSNGGTVTGTTTYVTGKIGKGISLNGSSYVTLANESNFDFEKVHRVMTYLNWEWVHHKGVAYSYDIPSIAAIVEKSKELSKKAYESATDADHSGRSNISSGGLVAIYNSKSDILTLNFTIEEFDTIIH